MRECQAKFVIAFCSPAAAAEAAAVELLFRCFYSFWLRTLRWIDQSIVCFYSPHEKGDMVTPPSTVKRPHVGTLEGKELDLIGLVVLRWIHLKMIRFVLFRWRVAHAESQLL